ncbi:DUF4158 domain-containing protein [Nocardia tengchongensis]|uniref:DUF4158 domain-containing protein n=1 Tax=Nocardia tengchongensis TaxID=2055889 RepID=UPI00367D51BE
MRDEGVGEYGRFPALSQAELERFFHLDDEDRKLIADRRRDYSVSIVSSDPTLTSTNTRTVSKSTRSVLDDPHESAAGSTA